MSHSFGSHELADLFAVLCVKLNFNNTPNAAATTTTATPTPALPTPLCNVSFGGNSNWAGKIQLWVDSSLARVDWRMHLKRNVNFCASFVVVVCHLLLLLLLLFSHQSATLLQWRPFSNGSIKNVSPCPPQQIPSPRTALFDCSDEFLNSLLNVLADLNLDEKSFLTHQFSFSLSLSLSGFLWFVFVCLGLWFWSDACANGK